MIICNNKLKIRTATRKDSKLLQKWWNDGKVMAHAGFPQGLGITDKEIISLLEKNNNFGQILIIEFDNKPIGEMNYRQIKEKTVKIGIKICDERNQNKGYGSKLIEMLIMQLFINTEYNRINLDTNLKNIRAQRVYERMGFSKLRTNIDSWKNQMGELQSSIDYEITKQEFLLSHRY